MLFLLTFSFAVVLTGGVILTNKFHGNYTHDADFEGEQKFHDIPTPRVGGIPIMLSFIFALIFYKFYGTRDLSYAKDILNSILLVFMAGFLEDVTKVITPLERTLFFIIALIIAVYLTNSLVLIGHTGFDGIDSFLRNFPFIAVGLTFFCVIGLTNAYNIIDGYHGLAAISAIVNLLGLVTLNYIINRSLQVTLIFGLIGSLLGFLAFNYPKGKIFLGDGGAYVIGFVIAVASIQLTQSGWQFISPYAVLLMAIYPITEMGFSIYRKKFLRKTTPTQPDGLHFHMLVFKRCTNFNSPLRNASVVVIMFCIIIPQVVLGIIFHKSTICCILLILVYICSYIFLYFRIVRFKTPPILKFLLKQD